jgi:hypothetical protein
MIMVHKIKRSKEEEEMMRPYEEEFKKMGIDIKEETEEDWLERQKKEYEKEAKEFIGMYRKASEIARKTKKALKKGRAFVQEKILHRETARRPVKVYLPVKKERKKYIEYGEW